MTALTTRVSVVRRLVSAIPAVILTIPAHAETLPFNRALTDIVSRNTAVASETANLNAARARALPAMLVFAPGVAVVGKTGRQGVFGQVEGENGQSLELDSDFNLFRFGADAAGWRAADQDIHSEEELISSARLSAEEQAVQVLVSRIQTDLVVAVAERIADNQEELHRIARERYERGLLPLQEADKIAVDLDNARARLADARVQEIEARAALATALGWEGSSTLQGAPATASFGAISYAGPDISPQWPWLADLSNETRVTALASERFDPSLRPDWRAAKHKAEAESDRLTREDALIFPSLDANFSYATITGFLSPTGETWGPAYTGTLALTVPLFDHLQNYSNSRVQAAVRDVADEQLEQTRRNSLGEWDAASHSLLVAVSSARARERTLAVARRLYQDNLARFRAGKASANDLSVDQTRLSDSESFAVQGWAAAHLAYARACHALGRSVVP